MTLHFAIDVLAVFNNRLLLSGWIIPVKQINSIALLSPGIRNGRQLLATYGTIDSPDVANHHGDAGRSSRFFEAFEFDANLDNLSNPTLELSYNDGEIEVVGNLVGSQLNPAADLNKRFYALINSQPQGHMLEVGSRARSGVIRRNLVPTGWDYTGLDILSGPNVDIVGDVHEATTIFPPDTFHAVMAFSVLEHLLMPWKAVIELNRVLAMGAIGLFTTHQCWPMHDEPWDFWRYSNRSWDGLLNRLTGFEIIETAMSEPAYVVAQRCHPVTNFGLQQSGFLASNVLFRKIGATALTWPVSMADAASTSYPAGNIS